MPIRRKPQNVTLANDDGIQSHKHYIPEEPEEINDNNVSINSDHNYEVTFASDDEQENQAHKPILSEEEDEVVPPTEPANISLEIEEVGGEVEMDFEEVLEEETEKAEKSFRPRGKNKVYVKVEEFETKAEFDKYWLENHFDELYYHHSERSTDIGSDDVFSCKFHNKSGFEKCQMQAKTVFPGKNESVFLYLTSAEHSHARVVKPSKNGLFTWKSQPEALEIINQGFQHNDCPSQILKAMDEAGINPLPNMTQINNKIANLRKKIGLNDESRYKESLLGHWVPGAGA